MSTVGDGLLILLVLLVALAFMSLVIRFRRSRGAERQQLKWFTYAGALLPLALLDDYLPAPVGDLIFGVVIVFLAVAAGIAILRYRLYDIDRLINRTLVYGLLTVLLGGGYAGAVLALGQVFGGVGQDPPSRPAAASRQSWIAGSTAASTMRRKPSRRSALACVTRSTWTRSPPSCWESPTRQFHQREPPVQVTLGIRVLVAEQDHQQPPQGQRPGGGAGGGLGVAIGPPLPGPPGHGPHHNQDGDGNKDPEAGGQPVQWSIGIVHRESNRVCQLLHRHLLPSPTLQRI